jgi:hypothetical protein
VYRVAAKQVALQLGRLDADGVKTRRHDRLRERRPRGSASARVGNLALADIAIAVADCNLEEGRS